MSSTTQQRRPSVEDAFADSASDDADVPKHVPSPEASQTNQHNGHLSTNSGSTNDSSSKSLPASPFMSRAFKKKHEDGRRHSSHSYEPSEAIQSLMHMRRLQRQQFAQHVRDTDRQFYAHHLANDALKVTTDYVMTCYREIRSKRSSMASRNTSRRSSSLTRLQASQPRLSPSGDAAHKQHEFTRSSSDTTGILARSVSKHRSSMSTNTSSSPLSRTKMCASEPTKKGHNRSASSSHTLLAEAGLSSRPEEMSQLPLSPTLSHATTVASSTSETLKSNATLSSAFSNFEHETVGSTRDPPSNTDTTGNTQHLANADDRTQIQGSSGLDSLQHSDAAPVVATPTTIDFGVSDSSALAKSDFDAVLKQQDFQTAPVVLRTSRSDSSITTSSKATKSIHDRPAASSTDMVLKTAQRDSVTSVSSASKIPVKPPKKADNQGKGKRRRKSFPLFSCCLPAAGSIETPL